MRLGLCMMVKDEANRVRRCLEGIVDLFDHALVVDTGSTDGTPDLLRDLGIEPVFDSLDPDRCYSFADVRNRALARLQTPWVLTLDADEYIQRDSLEAIIRAKQPESAGLFCTWNNWRPDGTFFEDYKCPVFRSGVESRGLIHDNVQFDLRRRGLLATWHDQLVIDHFPEFEKAVAKRQSYLNRLACAERREPTWYRYHWFAGYTLLREGHTEPATYHLTVAADSQTSDFPVECLNAKMVLVDLHARHGRRQQVRALLEDAIAFYSEVSHDFEVRVNFRMAPWFKQAWEIQEAGNCELIRAYEFAC